MDTVSYLTINGETREIADYNMRQDINTIQNDLNGVKTSTVYNTTHATVDARFEADETKIKNAADEIAAAHRTSSDTLDARFDNIENRATAVEDEISAAHSSTQISGGQYASLDARLDAIDSRITTVTTTPASDAHAQEILDARRQRSTGTAANSLLTRLDNDYDQLSGEIDKISSPYYFLSGVILVDTNNKTINFPDGIALVSNLTTHSKSANDIGTLNYSSEGQNWYLVYDLKLRQLSFIQWYNAISPYQIIVLSYTSSSTAPLSIANKFRSPLPLKVDETIINGKSINLSSVSQYLSLSFPIILNKQTNKIIIDKCAFIMPQTQKYLSASTFFTISDWQNDIFVIYGLISDTLSQVEIGIKYWASSPSSLPDNAIIILSYYQGHITTSVPYKWIYEDGTSDNDITDKQIQWSNVTKITGYYISNSITWSQNSQWNALIVELPKQVKRHCYITSLSNSAAKHAIFFKGNPTLDNISNVDFISVDSYNWPANYELVSFDNYKIDIPINATHMVINCRSTSEPSCSVDYSFSTIDNLWELHHKPSYYNKKILFLGDSITALGNGERGWPGKLFNKLNGSKYVNIAVNGARWCDYDDTVLDGNPVWAGSDNDHNNVICNQVEKISRGKDTSNPNYSHVSDYDDFDIIIISAGTNDVRSTETESGLNTQFYYNNNQVPLSSVDRKTWAGAIRYTYQNLRKMYPSAHIFICSPIQGAWGTRPYTSIKAKRDLILSICNRLSDVIFIDTFNCGILDLYEGSSQNGRDLIDGLHPNINGAEKIASFNSAAIISFYNTQ